MSLFCIGYDPCLWVCQRRKGTFPKVLEQTLSDRNKYLILLKQEQDKANPDPKLIEEYQTHQLGAKLFANAGFGLFGNEYFEFSNYQVAECITAEAARLGNGSNHVEHVKIPWAPLHQSNG